ncbi:MAG: tetrahydromethanopterin S-methyltransferase subunit F [Methanobrevibacter arboriphilus]|jgi:tetrahydromethanopterin S-methyltransferase subunit F|uniref:Tetrahydromethanopterin S-methyltransferase subunit F n=3 Tax=Methanobrevibacter arboriphilus TaxID=39441 RepID=A0A1V6N4J2_METAZ|nr:tetrahydromethanopterin S-methyltransferase subunit F [Methanobrevibacter arboriphilus]MBF4468403.1 tetrahydromethanopterin S-methyltransferase subunit F [Methanobrevibacter arboriphilus]MCC7561718.1 tetrahydromethanopterin S-methyltransferase subunit F [Methanobrevibacter arboriphilus]OQD59589.1 tetrahydromethanopterin S-methyltransferase, subunit F [Methanobrevibacter arboriphilus JCM 13429 = DSM 1125]BBL62508.1 tetrahydromethanopterin S-methyltransferase subunit F [Methanobrevibacter arbo
MVKLSNKPNVRGIKNVSEDIQYRSQLIGREGRLFAGLISTRFTGIGLGIAIAFLLVVVIPYIANLF